MRVISTVGFLAAGAALAAGGAQSAGSSSSQFYTTAHTASSAMSGLCMQPEGGVFREGVRMVTAACNGRLEQTLKPYGTNNPPPNTGVSGWAQMRMGASAANALCLDVSGGTTHGAPLILWRCHGGDNQLWLYNPGSGELRTKNGLCVDIPQGNRAPGTGLIVWSCHGGENQRWRLSAVPKPW